MTDCLILTKFGYAKQEFSVSNLQLKIRPGTSDETIVNSVLIRNVYQKKKIGQVVHRDAGIGDFRLGMRCILDTDPISKLESSFRKFIFGMK